MNEKKLNIYEKLVEVRKSVPYLQKGESGPQFKYVSSSQTLAAVRQAMDEQNLLLIPKITNKQVTIMDRGEDKASAVFTELNLEYTWLDASDPSQMVICPFYGQGIDIAGEKGVGKALTYAEKYFLLKFFNIATDKDDPDRFQQKTATGNGSSESEEPPEEETKPRGKQKSEFDKSKLNRKKGSRSDKQKNTISKMAKAKWGEEIWVQKLHDLTQELLMDGIIENEPSADWSSYDASMLIQNLSELLKKKDEFELAQLLQR